MSYVLSCFLFIAGPIAVVWAVMFTGNAVRRSWQSRRRVRRRLRRA